VRYQNTANIYTSGRVTHKATWCDSHSKNGSAQNFKSGNDCEAFASVETLTSRQLSASAARAVSAWPAY